MVAAGVERFGTHETSDVGSQRFPDFFIVGAPKCGTTALYEWLGEHPRVYAPHKEPGFFSQDIFPTNAMPAHISSFDAYMDIFGDALNPDIICGEATPKYLYSDGALTEIARHSVDPKIIVCLRDPVDLVISYHSQKIKEGREGERNFKKAWLRAMEGETHTPASLAPEIDGRINYFFWARVGARLEKLFDYFSPASVKIVLLNEIKSQPREVYLEILGFLGLEDDGRVDFFAVNERLRIRNLWLHRASLRLRRRLGPLLRPLHPLRGGQGTGVLSALYSLNSESGRYSAQVADDFRAEIYAILWDDIRLAESYLDGRKLVTNRGQI